MTPEHHDTKCAALAQLSATLEAMHRLREVATLLAHGLEQARETLAHGGDALWESAPDATAAMAWQVAQMNATRAMLVAHELDPAADGKAMNPAVLPEEEAT